MENDERETLDSLRKSKTPKFLASRYRDLLKSIDLPDLEWNDESSSSSLDQERKETGGMELWEVENVSREQTKVIDIPSPRVEDQLSARIQETSGQSQPAPNSPSMDELSASRQQNKQAPIATEQKAVEELPSFRAGTLGDEAPSPLAGPPSDERSSFRASPPGDERSSPKAGPLGDKMESSPANSEIAERPSAPVWAPQSTPETPDESTTINSPTESITSFSQESSVKETSQKESETQVRSTSSLTRSSTSRESGFIMCPTIVIGHEDDTSEEKPKVSRKHSARKSVSRTLEKQPTEMTIKSAFSKQYASRPLKMTPRIMKFQRVVRLVIAVRGLASLLIRRLLELSGHGQDVDMYYACLRFVGIIHPDIPFKTKQKGPVFDVAKFRADREISISEDAKLVLITPREKRTPEQIKKAMVGLQSIKSFAEYPVHLQEKICRTAWFSVNPPRKVIIRQGHIAENFYFVISGTATVSVMHRNSKKREHRPAMLSRGMCFGDLHLLYQARRPVTVTSRDSLELLSVEKSDFFDIFMPAAQVAGSWPDHILFLSQIEFMQNWPVRTLLSAPEACLCNYFRRNALIVESSLQSDWIYVVKMGACQVIKRLHGVIPTIHYHRKDPAFSGKPPFPKIGVQQFFPKVDCHRKVVARKPKSERQRFGRSASKKSAASKPVPSFSMGIPEQRPSHGSQDSNHRGVLKSKRAENADDVSIGSYDRETLRSVTYSVHITEDYFSEEDENSLEEKDNGNVEFVEMAEEEGGTTSESSPESEPSVATGGIPPVFVQIETIKPRGVFGLDTVHFYGSADDPTTDVSLVSLGAEVVLLSKAFFIKHAPEEVKRRVFKFGRVYPDEQTLQKGLQVSRDFELYKTFIIQDFAAHNPFKRCSVARFTCPGR